MPIHFIGSHSSIRHRTLLLISIHSHINTPYPLPSCILSLFYSSIHTPLHPPSLLYSLLIHPLIILPIHSFPHPLSPILFSFHPSSISISTPLSYTLLPLSFTNHSLIRFSPSILFSSLFPDSFLFPFYSSYCFSSPLSLSLSSSIFIRTHSILFILFSPIFRSFYSNHLLYHSYSFPYSLSFNHFFFHFINHFLLFPINSHSLRSLFLQQTHQISTYSQLIPSSPLHQQHHRRLQHSKHYQQYYHTHSTILYPPHPKHIASSHIQCTIHHNCNLH